MTNKCGRCGNKEVVGFIRTSPSMYGGFEKCEFRCKDCMED